MRRLIQLIRLVQYYRSLQSMSLFLVFLEVQWIPLHQLILSTRSFLLALSYLSSQYYQLLPSMSLFRVFLEVR